MADEPLALRGINWRETFPFTNLFRAFRVAVHPSKLVLGLILLLGIYTGGRILDGIWPARHLAVPGEVQQYAMARGHGNSADSFATAHYEARRALEEEYADLLLREQVVTDRPAAVKAAQEGGRLGALKEKIIARRDNAVEAAVKVREDALGRA